MPSPPETQRASARAALAVFEAVNAIDRRYQSYVQFPAGGRFRLAGRGRRDRRLQGAARSIIRRTRAISRTAMRWRWRRSPTAPAKQAGVAVGEQAAQAVMALGAIDPAVEQPPYRPRTAPGEWIGASPPSTEPYWFAFKPWAVKSVDALMVPPPPPLTSATWARDYEEVRRLGARASKERTPVQTLIAKYRQGFDLGPMVRYIADRPGRRQVDNARLLALYQMAMDDAVQAMIVAKLQLQFLAAGHRDPQRRPRRQRRDPARRRLAAAAADAQLPRISVRPLHRGRGPGGSAQAGRRAARRHAGADRRRRQSRTSSSRPSRAGPRPSARCPTRACRRGPLPLLQRRRRGDRPPRGADQVSSVLRPLPAAGKRRR